jgi:hypothetical protein
MVSVVTSRVWFMNPIIFCYANKEKIDAGTRRLFAKSLIECTVGTNPEKHK